MYVGANAMLTEISIMMFKEGVKQFAMTVALDVGNDLKEGKGLSDINMLETLKSIDGLDIAIGVVGDKFGVPGGVQALFSSLANVTLEDGLTTAFDGKEASEDAFVDFLVNSAIESAGDKFNVSTPSGNYAKTAVIEDFKNKLKETITDVIRSNSGSTTVQEYSIKEQDNLWITPVDNVDKAK